MAELLAFPFRDMINCASTKDAQESRVKYEHITIARIHELLNYSPETGAITWKVRPSLKSRKRAGDVAGTVQSTGFRAIFLDGKLCQATQIAFLFANGRWALGQVGVNNSDPLDLRTGNLRELRTTTKKHDFSTPEGKRAYSLDYWHTNAAYRRETGWKRYYRLTALQYKNMLDAQNGVCAICGLPELIKEPSTGIPKSLSVDHNHGNEEVRGLLCKPCNTGLGHFMDDPALLEEAAKYLSARGFTSRRKPTEFTVPVREAA